MMAAQQKAMIEARLVVALRQGRNYEKLRLVLGDLCKNPKFAETAMYLKPISRTPQGWNMLPMRDRLRSELLKRDRNRAAFAHVTLFSRDAITWLRRRFHCEETD